MRKVLDAHFGSRYAYFSKHFDHIGLEAFTRHVLVYLQGFTHLVFDVENRVERCHRVLKHHSDSAASDALHFAVVELENVVSIEKDLPANDVARG